MALPEIGPVRERATFGMNTRERLMRYREELICASNRITQRRLSEINHSKLLRIKSEIRRIAVVIGPRR